MHEQVRRVDARQLLRTGVDVDELLPGPRRLQQLVAPGRHLAQARPDREHEVGSRMRCASFGLMPMPTSPA